MTDPTPLVSVQNLKVAFRMEEGEPFQALKGITFDIPRNRTVALVGESGSGKSVTSMAILRGKNIHSPANEIRECLVPAGTLDEATLQELVDGLNSVGATPRDLISILRTLKTAGSLHADLEVI